MPKGAALKLDLPPNPLESYLRESIDFSLDAENLAGLNLYFDRCAEAGLIPERRPIEFAANPLVQAARGKRAGTEG